MRSEIKYLASVCLTGFSLFSLAVFSLGVASVASLAAASAQAQDITRLGGDLTSDLPGRNAIQVFAPNVTDPGRQQIQLNGFGVFHNPFSRAEGLGPNFVNARCAGCHIQNGKGPLKFSKVARGNSTAIVKVSRRGLNPDGSPRNVAPVGEQLLNHTTKGAPLSRVSLAWTAVRGKFADGTAYRLRRPKLNFSIRGKTRRGLATSLRMTPPVIGPGLLESVPDAVILELSDPNDANGDGISGHPNYVIDARTKAPAIGRFGFKASHPTVEQQSVAALIHDIGVGTSVFPDKKRGVELSDARLNDLVIYQKIAGVPPARNQEDPRVIAGKALFQSVGCADCHRMTMTTGETPDPELSNQEFHPFTDLLLHDMGPGLADKRAEFSASGAEWRTTPLWGLGFANQLMQGKVLYLHDGRARTIEEAILWHGGEAQAAQQRYVGLSKAERDDLLAFLNSL